MNKNPIFIEFAGIPGAGKSTITSRLLKNLTNVEYKCSLHTGVNKTIPEGSGNFLNKLHTLFQLLYATSAFPRVAIHSFVYATMTKPLTSMNFIRVSKLLLKLNRMKELFNTDYDVVILDQGLIQNVWSLAATGKPPDEKYMIRLLKSALEVLNISIVLIEIDAQTAVQRITERPIMKSRFDRIAEVHSRELLKEQSSFFKHIISRCSEIKGTRYLTISGNDSIEKNVSIVNRFLEQNLRVGH